MKRLLLLLPLFLLAPADAGNLGAADHVFDSPHEYSTEEGSSFRVHVLNSRRWTKPDATASFTEGKFLIKTEKKQIDKFTEKGFIPADSKLDESGILPEQVISFSHFTHNSGLITTFQLLYRDSDGRIQLAQWTIHTERSNSEKILSAFRQAFLNWMSAAGNQRRQ